MMMSQTNDKLIDVLIVGAGPAGLMMACQLALHNITFRIIDIKKSPSIYSGALIIHACTLEIFQQMGIADKVLEMGITSQHINMQFHNRNNYSLDINRFGERLTLFPHMIMIEQWQTEKLLQEFLKEKKQYVEKETSIIGFSQDEKLVISEISNPDGSIEIVKSKFLIAADGNDSFVRKYLQIPFTGKSQDSRLFITDCEASLPFSNNQIFFSFTNNVTSGFFPLKGDRWRVDGYVPYINHNDVNFNEVAKFFNSTFKGKIKLTQPTWFSVFRSHSRCAEKYRKKRCFLIGDAAHVHSPVGAQGMNIGIQDAYNLAWKLSYYIHGNASENILESYQIERKPVALKTIHFTDKVYSFMTGMDLKTKFLRLQLLPLILPLLIILLGCNKGMRVRIFKIISGIGVKYKKTNLSPSLINNDFIPKAPKPGERMPYIIYNINRIEFSLHEELTSTHFCLYIFGRDTPPFSFQTVLDKYKDIINVKCLNLETDTQIVFDRLGIKDNGFYLIRPDLYIACRAHELNVEVLNNYLQKNLI